jgi:hypothetical protein
MTFMSHSIEAKYKKIFLILLCRDTQYSFFFWQIRKFSFLFFLFYVWDYCKNGNEMGLSIKLWRRSFRNICNVCERFVVWLHVCIWVLFEIERCVIFCNSQFWSSASCFLKWSGKAEILVHPPRFNNLNCIKLLVFSNLVNSMNF